MPLQITNESYDGLPSLYANAGKWVDGVATLRNAYRAGSGTSNKFRTETDSLINEGGNWSDLGFSDGDSITIYLRKLTGPIGSQFVSFSKTITYINGNTMWLNSALGGIYDYATFPTDGKFTGAFVVANKQPQSLDFRFNLAMNGTGSLDSIIDGELNRFIFNDVAGMAVSDVENMVQLGNKSGGIVKDVTITRNANTTYNNATTLGSCTEYNYTINYKFLQYGLWNDSNTVPIWYQASDCPQPIIELSSYPTVNTANGKLTGKNGAQQSNLGWFGENYNGYPSAYTFTSIALTDELSNSIDQIAYNQKTLFTAVFAAPNQSNGNSVYRIGLAFTPLTETLYKNLPSAMENNIMLNSPDLDYLHSAVPDATNRVGAINFDGAGFDFDNLMFSHTAGVLTVTGEIIPTASSIAFFDALADGDRNLMMWVQMSDYTKTGQLNDEVNVLCYNDDCYLAPRIGNQYPDVVDSFIYDHAGNDITSDVTPNTTTEDDVLFVGRFTMPINDVFDGVRVGVIATNNISGETFTLEQVFFNFDTVPYIAGKHEVNETVNRGFLLPIYTDRNIIRLTRDTTLDTVTDYGIKLEYGFLNRWEYWLADNNVDPDLFDSTLPNNGLNRNWQAYQNGDWDLSIAYFVRYEGVDDFNYTPFKIRPYEDDPNIDFSVTYYDSNGDAITALPNTGIVQVVADFDWTQNFDEEWAEVTIESFEGARLGLLSSEYDHLGQGNNALQPVTGQTRLQLILVSPDVLRVKFDINCDLLQGQQVSLTYRSYSIPKVSLGYLITYRKDAVIAYSLRKVSNNETYSDSDPCIKVRRSSDNTLLDIGFVDNELDTASLLTFCGVGNGYIHTIYDQAGNANNAVQTDNAKQPLIVTAGVVNVDPDNGLPSWLYDGVDDFFNITTTFNPAVNLFQTAVFNRNATGNVTLGNSTDDLSSGLWFPIGDDRIFTILGPASYDHGANVTAGTVLLTTSHNSSNDTKVYVNGVLHSTVNELENNNMYEYVNRLGAFHGAGHFQEVIYWAQDKTAQKTVIESNIMTYYGL